MTRLCWWLANILCGALEPDESAVVRGDIEESGETASRALLDVFGLVVRRQASQWRAWPSWLALAGLSVPLGILFCLISRRQADSSAIYIWLYANNWDWSFLGNPGFRHELLHYAGIIALQCFTLFCWSWSSGFVLGSFFRRGIPLPGLLFGATVLFGWALGAPPEHFGRLLFHRARDFSANAGNSAVFSLAFYRLIFPVIVQIALVLAPALWGMLRGRTNARLRPVLRVLLWIAALASLPAIAIQTGLTSLPYLARGSLEWPARVLQIAAYWPAAYILASSMAHRFRANPVAI